MKSNDSLQNSMTPSGSMSSDRNCIPSRSSKKRRCVLRKIIGERAVADQVFPLAIRSRIQLVVKKSVNNIFDVNRLGEGAFKNQVMFHRRGCAEAQIDGPGGGIRF